jgi:hypothetical protein
MSRRKAIPLTPERIAALRSCPAMRVFDAIAIYQINRNVIYQRMADGSLPFRKLGGVTLLSVEALEALVRPEPRT